MHAKLFGALFFTLLLAVVPLSVSHADATTTSTTTPDVIASTTPCVDTGTTTPDETTPVPSPVSITLEIHSATTTLFSGTVSVAACATNNNATSTVNGYCAFAAAGVPINASWYSFGAMITAINGVAADASNYWLWFLNGAPASVGIDSYQLQPDDHIIWTIGREPMHVTVASTSPTVGKSVTVTALGFDTNSYTFTPLPQALVLYAGTTTTTDASGTAQIIATSTDPFTVSVTALGFLPVVPINVTPHAASTTTPDTGSSSNTPTPIISGSGGGWISHATMDVAAALAFLVAHQAADGSFGTALQTDWGALALAAGPSSSARDALKLYLKTHEPVFGPVTDYERHAIAYEALGLNPYTDGPHDYIAPIITAFDGTQVGDATIDNDDIFALIALEHAGYSQNDTIIKKIADFVFSMQLPDGSWDSSVDMTAAAIQAIVPLYSLPGYVNAVTKANTYLKSTQQSSGGWGNVDTTSWVITAITATNGAHPAPESAWATASGYYPADELHSFQQTDGGMRPVGDPIDSRIWSTEYAIVAGAGKDWVTLLTSFPRPSTQIATGASGPGGVASGTSGSYGTTTSSTATSTSTTTLQTTASTTAATATSTIGVGSTTPIVISTLATTSSSTKPTVKKHLSNAPKRTVNLGSPSLSKNSRIATSTAETAAAASVVRGNIFTQFWGFITHLFGH